MAATCGIQIAFMFIKSGLADPLRTCLAACVSEAPFRTNQPSLIISAKVTK